MPRFVVPTADRPIIVQLAKMPDGEARRISDALAAAAVTTRSGLARYLAERTGLARDRATEILRPLFGMAHLVEHAPDATLTRVVRDVSTRRHCRSTMESGTGFGSV